MLRRSAGALLSCVLLAGVTGCDLGTYGSRYESRLTELQTRAARASHLHASYQQLDGPGGTSLGARIRLPKLFDGESTRYSPTDVVSKPDQAGPPGMIIPLAYTFERYIESDGEKLPIYVYIGAVPTGELDAAGIESKLDEVVAAVITDAPKWAAGSYAALEGPPVEYRSLKIGAAQPFMVIDPTGKAESRTLEGQLYFHVKPVGNNLLLIGFRFPSQIADKIGFPEAMESSLGTLKL